MKKIFFNSSRSLRYLGHFNLIIGLLIIILFTFGSLSRASTDIWGSDNKNIEVSGDVVLPSANTIINISAWDSENKAVVLTATTSTTSAIKVSGGVNVWNSENKEISGSSSVNSSVSGSYSATKSSSSASVIVATTTSTKLSTTTTGYVKKATTTTSKEVSTLKISTINNNSEENNKIDDAFKKATTSIIEDSKDLQQTPFSIPIVDVGYQIQKTISVVNSLGTTSEKIVEVAYGVKTEDVNLLYKDTNKDGVSDYDSIYIYNIDPIKSSPTIVYEGKKINAGERILFGLDPTATSAVKIRHEEPNVSTVKEISLYKVKEIALNFEKQVTFKGKALPNSFVTLYIYSTPIIVTVKTDTTGEWEYILNRELEDGQHMVYTATVNNTGKILAKSAPFAFAKTAEAATLIPAVEKQVTDMRPEVWNSKYTIMITGFLILSVLAVLFVVGVGIRKNPSQINKNNPNDLRS